jgi:hypothetical protein
MTRVSIGAKNALVLRRNESFSPSFSGGANFVGGGWRENGRFFEQTAVASVLYPWHDLC